jgi:hypothetical protein
MSASTIIAARVIPRDEVWGVAITYSDRKHTAYPVGSRGEAEKEVNQLRDGGAPKPLA